MSPRRPFPLRFVIRVDDVGRQNSTDLHIMDALCGNGFRITCAVVPGWLTLGSRRQLRRLAARYSGAIEFHQHGLSHRNHGNALVKYEFGGARSYAQQADDIAKGYATLQDSVGEWLVPVFTPPYGAYTDVTVAVLRDQQFLGVSGCPWSPRVRGLRDLRPHVDCCTWDPPRAKSDGTITREWHDSASNGVAGIIVHPRLVRDAKAFAAFVTAIARGCQSAGFAELMRRGFRTIHGSDAFRACGQRAK